MIHRFIFIHTAALPVRTGEHFVSPELVVDHLRQVYPLLSKSSIRCDGDRFTFSATVLPMVAQTDLDKRQEMLLGGLAAALASDGYTLRVPFKFDEIRDNTFELTASVSPSQPLDGEKRGTAGRSE